MNPLLSPADDDEDGDDTELDVLEWVGCGGEALAEGL